MVSSREKRLEFLNHVDAIRERLQETLKDTLDRRSRYDDLNAVLGTLDRVVSLRTPVKMPLNSLADAQRTLDENHAGMTDAKDAVLNRLALLLLQNRLAENSEGASAAVPALRPILLHGLRKTGKTSFLKESGKVFGRQVAVVHCDAITSDDQLRLAILDELALSGTKEIVLVLDRVDAFAEKVSGSLQALLEDLTHLTRPVLRLDNTIQAALDMRGVLVAATATFTGHLPQAILRNFEVIPVRSYTLHEKIEIARRHVWPSLCLELGIENGEVQVSDDVLTSIIQDYTTDGGVGQLVDHMAVLLQGTCAAFLDSRGPVELTAHDVEKTLARHKARAIPTSGAAGYGTVLSVSEGGVSRVTGLQVLLSERRLTAGSGITIIGSKNKTMEEALLLAQVLVRMRPEEFGITADHLKALDNAHILLHSVGLGSQDTHGPSGTLSVLMAFVSCLRGQPWRPGTTMTGTFLPDGKVGAVGDTHEKALAAFRAGFSLLLVPSDNEVHVQLAIEAVAPDLTIQTVQSIKDVCEILFSE